MMKHSLGTSEQSLVKSPGQKIRLTPEQELEFLRCALDPVYFIQNYVYITHPTQGKQKFTLFDYQVDMIRTYNDYRQVVSMCSRQLGKTTTAAAYILWFAIFQEDQNVLIASNVFKAATEIMDRIRFAYEFLPDWLRPGVTVYNVQKIVFDNRSKIESTTTTPSSGRGKSISLLFCLSGDTTVTVRNKKTGKIEHISLRDLKTRLSQK
jgi:hypothetical protein